MKILFQESMLIVDMKQEDVNFSGEISLENSVSLVKTLVRKVCQ